MSYTRANKLNKLTILFTFSETGSLCSCFNLFSLITQNKQSVLWWQMDTSLLGTSACNLFYFTALYSRITQCQMMNQRLSSITEITEPVQIPLAFLKESSEGAKRRGKSSNQDLFMG